MQVPTLHWLPLMAGIETGEILEKREICSQLLPEIRTELRMVSLDPIVALFWNTGEIVCGSRYE